MQGAAAGHDLVVETIRTHAPSLLRMARRHSVCTDDAQDAYQRALEIFVRRAASLDGEHAVGWLHTVVKHEAMAVRAARLTSVGSHDLDADTLPSTKLPTDDERIAAFDRLSRSAEALQRLKPQEVRALVLLAEGHSYHEICGLTGWSYTKVNRCVTEGRRAFLDRYAGIESGRECERWSPVLSALADGEASAADLQAVRPHLRNCPGCRARLRDAREMPARIGALIPVAALGSAGAPDGGGSALLTRLYEMTLGSLGERAALSAARLHAGAEALSAGKLAAVAASASAIAGGGIAATHGVTGAATAGLRASAGIGEAAGNERGRAESPAVPIASASVRRAAVGEPRPRTATHRAVHRSSRPPARRATTAPEFGFEARPTAARRQPTITGRTAAASSSLPAPSSGSPGTARAGPSAPAQPASSSEFGP